MAGVEQCVVPAAELPQLVQTELLQVMMWHPVAALVWLTAYEMPRPSAPVVVGLVTVSSKVVGSSWWTALWTAAPTASFRERYVVRCVARFRVCLAFCCGTAFYGGFSYVGVERGCLGGVGYDVV